MNEFKGTPGPWEVTGACCDAVGANFDKGGWYKPIANRPPRTGGKHTDEYNANLHLIAAAPELLDALQDCLSWVNNGIARDAHTKATQAIKKALGETK